MYTSDISYTLTEDQSARYGEIIDFYLSEKQKNALLGRPEVVRWELHPEYDYHVKVVVSKARGRPSFPRLRVWSSWGDLWEDQNFSHFKAKLDVKATIHVTDFAEVECLKALENWWEENRAEHT